MNPDPFEQRLSRLPLRPVPAEWCEEMLSPSPISYFPSPSPWWREWLWPCPQAWAALAAVWVLLLAVNFSNRDHSATAYASAKALPVLPYAWREQQKLLAELFPPEPVPPPRPRVQPAPAVPPAPRSELRPAARREEELA